ncbi:MAG: efflux RND transporter periplasmic adaptor subunit [Acidobacteria bacterium]|nr:efflux RND transporter periplasmic adaptor subunit [Acidobacteriota bacterium]
MNEHEKPNLAELRIDRHQRTAGRGGRWILVATVAVIVALAATVVFVLGSGRTAEVEVAAARPGAGSQETAVLNASGYVTPRRKATVAAKVTGRVSEVMVEEGMQVEKGQVLARLDDSDARARRDATKAERDVARAGLADLRVNLANAERNLKRVHGLAADQVASREQLDDAETTVDSLKARLEVAKQQLDAAEAQLAVAQQDLDNYVIRSPFAGTAVSKDAQPGEMVSPVSAGGGFTRTGISTIVDMSSLEIEVDVNESYIARVTPGQRVEAVLDAYPDWRIPAHVRTVIPTADRQKATVKVRISFEKLDPRILPDMGVKVTFLEPAQRKPGTAPVRAVVPQTAIRKLDGKSVAFVLSGDTITRRAVSLGQRHGSEVDILAGVEPGEKVVVAGPENLEDGQRVKVRE